jgi:hypothetical protein
MDEPASGRAGRPAAVARVCRELSQRGAHHRAGQHVGRVVHTDVDARVRDERRERVERELGIRTWRASGTPPARRSGRRRRTSGFTATLTTVAVTPRPQAQ